MLDKLDKMRSTLREPAEEGEVDSELASRMQDYGNMLTSAEEYLVAAG